MRRYAPGSGSPLRTARSTFAVLLAGGLAAGSFGEASAQGVGSNQLNESAEELRERPTELSPQRGPPGTKVTVRGLQLPAVTPVNVAFGGTRSGFEGLSFILTDRNGVVEETVEVPEWAERDRIHRFIIFDAYFDPISMTDLFHVTDEDGRIVRQGEVQEVGPTCARVAGEDDDFYWVVEADDDLEVGERVRFEAELLDSSECGEGAHVRVITFDPPG